MKKLMLSFCILVLSVTNLLSQSSSITSDTGYVNVDGGKLFYEVAGKGENIVLLHDGMVNHRIWDEQFPVLAKNYRVVRYDRRSYGKSTDPQTKYSHIDDLNQVFIQLKVDKAIVFGMSSGFFPMGMRVLMLIFSHIMVLLSPADFYNSRTFLPGCTRNLYHQEKP